MVHLTGDFSLRSLKPTDFNLTSTGQLLVVKESTGASELSMAGNLFVQIDPAGLHYTGTLDHSLLKGHVSISNSTLIFPPTRSNNIREDSLSIPMAVVDDTTKVREQRISTAEEHYFGGSQAAETNPEETASGIPSKSFLDGVRYDLTIETGGENTEIRMIFNQATNEELVATIVGKFTITDDGTRWFGDLDISRAYYNFFRRFDASGKIRFTGRFHESRAGSDGDVRGNAAGILRGFRKRSSCR